MLCLIACGGSGTRLLPLTRFLNKHLCPVGQGKLMVDMPLEFLAAHEIKEVNVITGSNHATQIVDYIGDGEAYGFTLVKYTFQPRPAGIADVLKRVSHKKNGEGVLLILGDNFFSDKQTAIAELLDGARGSRAVAWEYDLGSIDKASAFGQAFRDEDGNVTQIVEKPAEPEHGRILTGLYYFPADVFELVEKLTPSARGELEITDLLRMYHEQGRLDLELVEGQWMDLGEDQSWMNFVRSRNSTTSTDS